MKNLKKYLLIVACAASNAALVLAMETPEQAKQEVKENQNVTAPADKDKQIVPVTPAVATEQNQIVKVEEQKQESKPEIAKPEDVKQEQPAQVKTPITKTFFNELINLPREKRPTSLGGGLTLLLNNSLDQVYSKEEQQDWVNILAHWLTDEWTKDFENKISAKDFNAIVADAASYVEQLKKENNFSIISDLILLDDVYKPYFLKTLFPELENELKDVKLNETSVSIEGSDENSSFSFYSYSFVNLPEEECLAVAKETVDIFKKLTLDKQLAILASWILGEWEFDLESEKAEK